MNISGFFVRWCLVAALLFPLMSVCDEGGSPVLDYKLEYKTVKKSVELIGWEEFDPSIDRPPEYYLKGTYSGSLLNLVIMGYGPESLGAHAARLTFEPGYDVVEIFEDPLAESISAFSSHGGDLVYASSREEYKSIVQSLDVEVYTHPTAALGPPYPYAEINHGLIPVSHTEASHDPRGVWVDDDPAEGYGVYSDLLFVFSEHYTEDRAEQRAEELVIHPNPAPPPANQPSLDDISMVGASFREARTSRSYVRYASEFNLRLKLCPGEYVLKWRVTGKHKDDTGAPEHFPQERSITIDENTSLDAEGYYDLDWIDIAQQLTPDVIYRLSTYKDGATQTFHIESKDECGCADVGSGGVEFGSVKAWFNLGKDSSGKSAGFIKLHSENIATNSHLPEALTVVRGDSGSARFVYDENGALRQAQSDKRIIDIVPLVDPDEGYQLKFYAAADATGWSEGKFRTFGASGGMPAATPELIWTVKRLEDAGGFKRLEVTRSEGGTDFVHIFGQDTTTATTWSFSEANGLRTTTRSESSAPSGDLYRTTTLSDAVYGTASVKRERVHTFAWGEEVIEETLDPAGANPITTSYQYYTSGVAQGQLWKTTQPDGSITENTYVSTTALGVTGSKISSTQTAYPNGRVQTTTHGTLADLTSVSGDAVNSLVTTTETFGGQVIRKSWQISYAAPVTISGVAYQESRSIRAAATSANWNDSRNPVTITRVANTSTGRVNVTLSPDGNVSRTHHSLPDSEGIRIITTETGPADSNGVGLLTGSGGTRTEQEIDAQGRTVQTTTTDILSDLLISLEIVTDWSATNSDVATHISYLDGSEEVRNYSTCCGKLESITRHGQTRSYTYDGLGRQETQTSNGITTKMRYDAAGRVRETVIYPEGSPTAEKLVSALTYDVAGRLTATTTPHGTGQTVTTTTVETVNATTGETTTVTTYPSDTNLAAGVVSEIAASDGFTVKVTGNAARPVAYSYSAATLADATTWGYGSGDRFFITVETKLDASGDPTAETVTTYQDALGRSIKTQYADGSAQRRFYAVSGRLEKEVDPDGVTILHDYEIGSFGEKTTVAVDLAATIGGTRNGLIDLAGGYDRVTHTTTSYANRGGETVRRSKTEVWENGTAATEVAVSDVSVNGLKSWQTVHGLEVSSTVRVISIDGDQTETTTRYDLTSTVRTTTNGRLATAVHLDSNSIPLRSYSYGYDDYGRMDTVTQVGMGTTLSTYYDDGQVHTVTSPDPDATRSDTGYEAQTTTYTYNSRGWQSKVTHPDETETETTYWPTGQAKRTWGSRTYPVDYTYDPQGRMKTMTTWQDFAGTSGAAVTTWNYSPTRGWLDNKRYDDNKGPTYTYTDAGRMETRTWQRETVTTYGYTDAGDLRTVTYSDSTPAVTQTYLRDGKLHTTTDAAGVLTRTYTAIGGLEDEVYSGTSTLLTGLSVERGYDSLHRLESLDVPGATLVEYGYDDASRLETITQGTHVATVGYKPNAGTVQTVTVTVSGTERAKQERTTDMIGRVGRVDTIGNGSTLHARRDYTYNDANQRTRVEHEDARRWVYGYDALGQVTSAEKLLSDNTTVLPGYQFGYAFDDIGNRTSTTINDRTTTYTPNDLNGYDERQVAGAVDVRGSASAGVAVVVNDLLAARSGTDFFKAAPVTNTSTAVNAAIKIQAVKVSPEQVATENRTAFVAKTPEVFDYDDDGNLKEDGRWTYTWDGENRLKEMETLPAVATAIPALKKRMEFAYDAQGRRIAKTVKTWNTGTSTWAVQTDVRFLYDGWNLVGEYLASGHTPVQLPVWGLDLSGSMQGAGGVGGLLWVTKTTATQVPGYDGNGNVIAWLDSSNGTLAGEAEYGAFGEPVLVTGAAATQTYGFSTKYQDAESGLLYYGLRYYNPSTGRWKNRDPIEEAGGLNLYGMVDNDAINQVDLLGLRNCREIYKVKFEEAEPIFEGVSAKIKAEVIISKCDDCDLEIKVKGGYSIIGGFEYKREFQAVAFGYNMAYGVNAYLKSIESEYNIDSTYTIKSGRVNVNTVVDILYVNFGMGVGASAYGKTIGPGLNIDAAGNAKFDAFGTLGLSMGVSGSAQCAKMSLLGTAKAEVWGEANFKFRIKVGRWTVSDVPLKGFDRTKIKSGGFDHHELANISWCP